MAPQLTATNGFSLRGERAWMVRAMTSLPEPVSPTSSTGIVVRAIFSTVRMTSSIAGDVASGVTDDDCCDDGCARCVFDFVVARDASAVDINASRDVPP